MTKNKDPEQIKREFEIRQSRQMVAVAVAMFLVLLAAVLYKRPGLLGEFSKGSLFGAQILTIAAFMGFSAYNWRCPSCNNHLGSDITRRYCKHCKTELR